ncbi:SusC/RagA family TonB-linked outer membrane protein [Sphingobacterium composti]|uniref:SusC/RagA family TonB-linked outer membrane protein n=1 Tax=Sphingobacterium composti TaxID=363260 RepID=UPI001356EDBA|nr:TonB-dependent receptor [Sphingobacterium composti Ten et al. 2007 non Yoo et al. 2007]
MRGKLLLLILFCFIANLSYAQNRTVSGQVTDANTKSPIAGVSIKVSQSNNITQTDALGRFTTEIGNQSKTLSFSYIGYNTQIVNITNSDSYQVAMNPSADNIEEVVVVGYGTQTKKSVTGSTTTVKMNDLEDAPLPTIESALQGRATGVFVNSSSGKLGQALQIRVRGISSITAGNQPLFVIDGVPIITRDMGTYDEPDNPLAAINPDDIESLDVLKDAAAAAIYGARGSNGVVLITTKKGKAGRTNIDLSYYGGSSTPTKKGNFLNATQYKELLTTSVTNAGYIGSDPDDQYPTMADFWADWTGGDDWDQNNNSNWVDAGLKKGNMQQIALTLNGGNDKTRFIASGAHNDNKGIIIGNRFVRTSGRLGIDHNVASWLDFGGNINLNKIDNYRVSSDNAFSNPLQLNALPPIHAIRNEDGELNKNTVYYNNLIDLENGSNLSNTYRTFSNVYATAKITPYLTFRSEYGLDFINLEEELFLGSRTQDGGDSGGYGFSYMAKSINYNTNNTLTYQNTFNEVHKFGALAGMSYQDGQFRYTQAEGKNFPSDSFRKIASAAVKSDASSYEDQFSFLSYFARVNYSYSDRYLFEASIRTDGSSRFGSDRQYGTFPAASLGWIVSEENFFGDSPTWNYFKLRASYGLTGNAEIGNYGWRTLYSGVNYAGTPGTKPNQLGDKDLTWENTAGANFGVDLGFFNDRLSTTIDLYHKKTTDLLLDVPIVSTSGFTTILQNYGSLQNKGIEFSFNSRNLVGEFRWSTSFNIAFNQNKILTLVDGQPIYSGGRYLGRIEEGKPFGYFYGKAYAGVDPDNGDALYFIDDSKTTTTNDYSEAADQEIGNPNPKFYGGFGNKFKYKNFDLDIQTQFVYGNDIYNAAGAFQASNGDYFDNQIVTQMNYWKKPGDITDIPQPRFDEANGIRPSSRYIQDGSYFRVKNLIFGYNILNEWLSKYKVQKARLFISASNLLTLTKYEGYDPEINTTFAGSYQLGTDFYTPPQAKTITFGINVGF